MALFFFIFKFVAFKECGLHNLTNDSLVSCKNYLKVSTNNLNLTIIDQIETPKLILSIGNNIFFTSEWNLPNPFLIQKGYVPLIRRFSNSNSWISKIADPFSPDYFCLNSRNVTNNESFIFNISSIKFPSGSAIYSNLLINFVYNNPNQTILSNYTLNYSYNLFGTFPVNIYTPYGGNLLSPSKKYINVQRIKTYPFRSIQLNQFDLNCTLNGLKLDCILRVNLSNYANSFQEISIDYGDGIRFDSFMINPYCKYSDISFIN